MPSADDWMKLLKEAQPTVNAERRPKAVAPLRKWGSASKPVLVWADDEMAYVVKGVQVGRPLFTDQVVARVGWLLGAPVGQPAIVILEETLIKAGGFLAHCSPGPAHGTVAIAPVTKDKELGYAHTSIPENRTRFALLAFLYGWFGATDHQFLYGVPPASSHVYSVDHGHFLGGDRWTLESLGKLAKAVPDATIVSQCSLDRSELDAARAKIAAVTDHQLAQAIAWPPDEWKVTTDERIAVAAWLSARRSQLAEG